MQPKLVACIVTAYQRGARLAADLAAEGVSARALLSDGSFDWGKSGTGEDDEAANDPGPVQRHARHAHQPHQ